MEQRAPRYQVRKGRRHRSIGQALASIWETDSPVHSLGLHRTHVWPKDHRSAPGLFSSFLLHFSVVFLLIRLPVSMFLVQPSKAREHPPEQVVYVLHHLDIADYFLTLKPRGLGGKPGQGSRPGRLPAPGGTAFHPTLTIISNPPHPDNSRQTIVQSTSPPELKIPNELRLPNILIGTVAPPPAAPLLFSPAAPAPKVIERPVMPLAPAPAPQLSPPALVLVPPRNPLPNPALPVPLPLPPAPPTQPSKAKEMTTLAELDTQRIPSGGGGLLSLSVEPGPAVESVALPPGNRQGAFSTSPAGGKEGSPGGVPNADTRGGGSGGMGAGGDASTGLNPGDRGGGGKGAGGETSAGPGSGEKGAGGSGSTVASPTPNENVSISGGQNENKEGVLPSFFAATIVYPVTPPGPRRPLIVVTAGPTGGGGLQAYGVLKGGKIYTIYLPMPGKNWILQYCAQIGSATSQGQEPHSVEIKLDPGVVPPSAVEQFDFRRPPLSESAASRKEMIILQGIIREDGSVGELKVYKRLLEAVDQAALAAFSRWKFRPAQRFNKPIAVEVLVGIPVALPAT